MAPTPVHRSGPAGHREYAGLGVRGATRYAQMEDTSFDQGETMSDTRAGDRVAFFLLGAAVGAAAALLLAPTSGARTRRRLVRKGEEVADYLIDAGKELVEKCENL